MGGLLGYLLNSAGSAAPAVLNAARMGQADPAQGIATAHPFESKGGFQNMGLKQLLALVEMQRKKQAQMAARNAGPSAMRG